jgi:hypothetical protein
MNMNEKIKEKDKLITKLQTELLQLQEFLNQMQKDKQNELYSTYNTMKSIDNTDTNYNNSLTAFLNTPSILKFNKNTQKLRNNLNINKNSLYYFHSSFNKAKAGFKQKHNSRCKDTQKSRHRQTWGRYPYFAAVAQSQWCWSLVWTAMSLKPAAAR